MLPKTESAHRIALLKSRMGEQDMNGALLTYPLDLYYFTGTRQNAALWVPLHKEPVLLVRKSLDRAKEETAVEDVRPFPPSRELPDLLGAGTMRIGMTFDVLPVQHHTFYSGLLPGSELVDASTIVRELRSVKSAWELELIRRSGRVLSGVFSQIPPILKMGMTELDLAVEIEYRLRKAGSSGRLSMRAFGQEIVGITASGKNASGSGCFDGPITGKGLSPAAPFGPSRDPITKNVPIVVDYAGSFEGYMVDMTRVFSFGDISPVLAKAFEISLAIQTWVAESLRPGAICEEIYDGAVEMASRAGLERNFMGQARFIGHGVGLELDELPVLARGFKALLQSGHVIAVEPKFIFPGEGAIGIENTFAVTGSGCERLTSLADEIVKL